MTVTETIKRWFVGTPAADPDRMAEYAAMHEDAVAQQKAYWRGFNDGRQQATCAYLLTGNAVGRLRD